MYLIADISPLMIRYTLFLLLLLVILNASFAFVSPSSNVSVKKIPSSQNIKLNAASDTSSLIVGRNLAVAGRVPWRKLLINKKQAMKVISIMRAETHLLDVVMVLILSIFPEKIGQFFYNNVGYRFRKPGVQYEDSYSYQVTETISQASRIALVLYFLDTFEVALEVAGIKSKKVDISKIIGKLLYATWITFRVRIYKRGFFQALVNNAAPKSGRSRRGKEGIVEIFDKISDFFTFLILAFVWSDILKVKRGNGLSSIFALSGAGTFAITLASQDLVKRMLNGVALAASDAFNVGDSILLGDGTTGIVTYMGWLNTEIRGFDEVITKIPNTQLSDIRISNRSRMIYSQVKQRLRFEYEAIDIIPELCEEIREEIARSCPKVVTDGSRTFRVKWTDYQSDHVEVVVDCRLRNGPSGEKYYEARQGILEAIARAVKKRGIKFAVPTKRSIK